MTNRNYALVTLLALGSVMIVDPVFAQSAVDFSKADTVGNTFIDWMRGNAATILFTLAFVITGFMAAYNRLSWMWPIMICIGALLTFGAPTFVAELRAVFT